MCRQGNSLFGQQNLRLPCQECLEKLFDSHVLLAECQGCFRQPCKNAKLHLKWTSGRVSCLAKAFATRLPEFLWFACSRLGRETSLILTTLTERNSQYSWLFPFKVMANSGQIRIVSFDQLAAAPRQRISKVRLDFGRLLGMTSCYLIVKKIRGVAAKRRESFSQGICRVSG